MSLNLGLVLIAVIVLIYLADNTSSEEQCGVRIENGRITAKEHGRRTVIRFKCDRGFVLKGDRKVICRKDGKIKGSVPKCEVSQKNRARTVHSKRKVMKLSQEDTKRRVKKLSRSHFGDGKRRRRKKKLQSDDASIIGPDYDEFDEEGTGGRQYGGGDADVVLLGGNDDKKTGVYDVKPVYDEIMEYSDVEGATEYDEYPQYDYDEGYDPKMYDEEAKTAGGGDYGTYYDYDLYEDGGTEGDEDYEEGYDGDYEEGYEEQKGEDSTEDYPVETDKEYEELQEVSTQTSPSTTTTTATTTTASTTTTTTTTTATTTTSTTTTSAELIAEDYENLPYEEDTLELAEDIAEHNEVNTLEPPVDSAQSLDNIGEEYVEEYKDGFDDQYEDGDYESEYEESGDFLPEREDHDDTQENTTHNYSEETDNSYKNSEVNDYEEQNGRDDQEEKYDETTEDHRANQDYEGNEKKYDQELSNEIPQENIDTVSTVNKTEEEEYEDEYEYEETSDPDAELLYRNYEILSEFYTKHFVDLRVLDTTCRPERNPPPQIENGYVKEFRTVENVLLIGKQYHEVIYSCNRGYKLSSQSLGHMFCQEYSWMGVQPYCEKSTTVVEEEDEDEYPFCEGEHDCEHICKVVNGRNECSCRSGYTVEGNRCVDIDECVYDNGGCEYMCENKPGTYTCECMLGFTPDGMRCMDNNECLSNNGHGPCQDTCTNTHGSFVCSCQGIPGSVLAADGLNCEEVDFCEDFGCSHECHTSFGQSFCLCPEGLKLDSDWKTCIDVDECTTMESVREACRPGKCVNTQGSYVCVDTEAPDTSLCSEGYIFDEGANVCVDVDECIEDDPCGQGQCVNGEPGYTCQCGEGFKFDGTTCVDVDECSEGRVCRNSDCTNLEGSFRCDCHQGFESVNGECIDKDECLSSEACGGHGYCLNTAGSYRCDCDPGFVFEDGRCVDVDECATSGTCPGRSRCVNTPGGYECKCRGKRIFDKETGRCRRQGGVCSKNPNICGPHGTCRPLRGGHHTCVCKDGFQLSANRTACQDTNECSINNGGCEHNCENRPGSFRCLCQSGFKVDLENPLNCVDFDECAENTNNCQQECVNLVGSFQCSCYDGYEIDATDPNRCVPSKDCPNPCSHDCAKGFCICPVGLTLGPDEATCLPESQVTGCPALDRGNGTRIKCSADLNAHGMYPTGTICRGKCLIGHVPNGRLKMKCDSDGHWQGTDGSCDKVSCPPLQLPADVIVSPVKCAEESNPAMQKCKFSCPPGFKLLGSRVTRCRRNREWKYKGGAPKCVHIGVEEGPTTVKSTAEAEVEGKMYIYCPPDVVQDMPRNQSSVMVRIPRPKTNANWYTGVRSTPPWAKQPEKELGLGKTLVTFTTSGGQDEASCSFTIHVRDTIPPSVYNCPNDFDVFLEEGKIEKAISWDEPVFADNVKISHVMASKLPGQVLKEGRHDVLYQAADMDGNKARCVFTITVRKFDIRRGGAKKWVVCRVGSTGRQIKLFVSRVPRGCRRLPVESTLGIYGFGN